MSKINKKCLYCEENISNYSHNKIICNSILCLRKRDIEVRKLSKINFCIICKEHHIIRFNNILKDVLNNWKIKNFSEIVPNSELFNNISNDVINKHNMEMGVVLCSNCHIKVHSGDLNKY